MIGNITDWLENIGLGRYAAVFAENDVDFRAVLELTEADLKELGLSLGHRKILLKAIAALADAESAALAKTPMVPHLDTQQSQAPEQKIATGQGERRHLTVMFCDLVGATALSASMDPEEWGAILAEYRRLTTGEVERFGGYIAQYLGDGVMVYFGWPVAQENDAERAVRAGLAIITAMGEFAARQKAEGGPELAVRIGVHAGPTVVDEGAFVFGDVPNIASRVQTAAASGSLLISPAVHRPVAGLFVVEDLGPQDLKGVPYPMRLYRVLRASGARSRLGDRADLTPLVGREEEMRSLGIRWARARAGEGQVVLVSGEPGLGKSRLLEEFRRSLADEPHTWVEWPCSQLFQSTPFHPFVEWGRMRFGGPEVPAEKRIAELAKTLAQVGLHSEEAVALLATTMDIPRGESAMRLEYSLEETKRRRSAAHLGWMRDAARQQAIITVIEDVQWADPSTLDFLCTLVEQVEEARILVLMSARPEFRSPWPHRSNHAILTLSRLGRNEVRRMVVDVAMRHALATETVDAVVTRTGGVPLFVEEVTRLLLDSADGEMLNAVPPSLQASLAARLDRLGPVREVAQVAAVIGREFDYALLRLVAGAEEDDLQEALAQLVKADFLHVQGFPPEANYRFKHALIRDVAYEGLLKSRRRELHRKVADSLLGPLKVLAENKSELLGHHLAEAGETAGAVAALQRAAEISLARGAFAEAAIHYGKARKLSDDLGDGAAERLLRFRLQIGLGRAIQSSQGFGAPEVKAAFVRARVLAGEIEDANERSQAYYGLFSNDFVVGNGQAARETAQDMLENSEPGSCTAALAHYMLGLSEYFRGGFREAQKQLEAALGIANRNQDGRFGFMDYEGLVARVETWLGPVLLSLGDVKRAVHFSDDSIKHAEASRDVMTLAYALSWCCYVKAFLQDCEDLKTNSFAMTELADRHAMPFWTAFATYHSGMALSAAGDREAGIGKVRKAMDHFQASGAYYFLPTMKSNLAELEAQAGRPEVAGSLANEAFELMNKTGELSYEAELHRVRGSIFLKQDPPDFANAESAFVLAIETARRQEARTFELRAALAIAKLYGATGRGSNISEFLAPALEGFAAGSNLNEVAEANRMLAGVAAG
jgi:class 3 adenylate cyclase/tetratricopeptide (TPR) repeat protein